MRASRSGHERSPAGRAEPLLLPRAARSSRRGARNQHAIPKAVKAVALADRLGIGGEDPLLARERADQHQQRALREMKVRDDGVDHLEPVAGKDQETGPTISGSDAV